MIGGLPIEQIIRDLTYPGCTYVVTGETSMALRDVGTTLGYPVCFEYNGPILFRTPSAYVEQTEVECVVLDETVVIQGIVCTNQLRTIREMIRDSANAEFICQDIYDYVEQHSLEELYAYASAHGFSAELDVYVTDLDALGIYND